MRRLKVRIFFPIFSFWLVFIVLVPTNCFPWRKSVHKYMSWEATMVMPDNIHVILQNNMNSLLQGTIDPDNIKVADHQNVSECARMIKKYAKIAKEMIRKGEDWEKIVFVLGQAAHYIQDLNQPQHSSNYEKGHEHRTFEELATSGGWERDMYDGFHYIKNTKSLRTIPLASVPDMLNTRQDGI